MTTPADEALLHDLLDGRLATADAARLRARVEHEVALRETYDELLRTRELLRSWPVAEPPPDFVARVRARIASEERATEERATDERAGDERAAHEGASGERVGDAGPAASGGAPAASRVPPDPLRLVPPAIPPAWRRLMVAAYAMAALLVVAIGVLSLQRGQERGAAPVEQAQVPATDARTGAPALAREASEAAQRSALPPPEGRSGPRGGAKEHAWEQAEDLAASQQGHGKKDKAAGPGALGAAEPKAAPGESELKRRQGGEARAFGPGGAVPPGLRQPFDGPEASAPSPTPPAVSTPADLPTALDPVVPDVYVLEAESAEEGRGRVAALLQGPGTSPAGDAKVRGGQRDGIGADGASGFTPVALRRVRLDTDRPLLVQLGIVRADTPARGGGGGGSLPGAQQAPSVLADFSRALSATELARLEAVLGPVPATPGAATGAAPGAATPAAAPAAAAPSAQAPTIPPAVPTPAAPRPAVVAAPQAAPGADPAAIPRGEQPGSSGASPAGPSTRPSRLVRFIVLAPSTPPR